jgi:hypothetical protein
MVFQNNVLAGGAGGSGTTTHTIDQSIRFNDNDTAHMTRTFGSGNQKVWTMSFWVKRANLGTGQRIISRRTGGGSTTATMGFLVTTDQFDFYDPSNGGQLITDAVFRDSSAWYNFVINYEASNSIQSERLRIYVNGTRQTFTTNVAISDANGNFNAAVVHAIGKYQYNNTEYLDGYLAEIVWIDGTALDPSSFAEENENGIWIPKDVSELTFGTNGFHIDGRDSADLGDDESGNGNDFTTSGLAAHDQVSDSPSNNFCTYNSIQLQSGATLSDGNLDAVSSGSSWRNVHSTIGVSSGKWYWEVKADVIDSTESWIAGIQETSFESKSNYWWQAGYTASTSGIVFGVLDNNYKVTNTTRTSFTHDIAQGDIVQFQLNLDDNELTVLVDGVSKGKIYDITADTEYTPAVCLYNTSSATINFGQEGTFGGTETAGGNSDGNGVGNFKYSVPSGYLALCTKNLGS